MQDAAETKQEKGKFLSSSVSGLSFSLPSMFIAYCVVYLIACPSANLACAIGAEVLALAISIIIFKSKIFSLPSSLASKVPETIRDLLQKLGYKIDILKLAILSVASAIVLIDFTAMSLSVAGMRGPAVSLYTIAPASYWIGLHPAFSLEMLAGAMVQSQKYDRAEPLYKEIREIRVKLAGPKSDLASAIYADLGDLYVRKKDLDSAEYWYRCSVALGAKTGRSFTGLATVLREKGQLVESESCYLKALDLRKRIYGVASKQYSDTQRAYEKLLQMKQVQSN